MSEKDGFGRSGGGCERGEELTPPSADELSSNSGFTLLLKYGSIH